MENKQTAVEWLREQLYRDMKTTQGTIIHYLLEQALAMEKEQMFELWNGGINCTEEGGKSFDQYYNETYGK
jgi:hypothetical protein